MRVILLSLALAAGTPLSTALADGESTTGAEHRPRANTPGSCASGTVPISVATTLHGVPGHKNGTAPYGAPIDTRNGAVPASGHDHHACAYDLWRSTWGWVIPISHTGYAPGTLRDPIYSWYKHPYLAYRGNFYTHGFDYRWQFDYPWHKTHCSSYGYCTPCAREASPSVPPLPSVSQSIPAPSAVSRTAVRATRDAANTSSLH